MKYSIITKGGKMLHTDSLDYANEFASMNGGEFVKSKIGNMFKGDLRKRGFRTRSGLYVNQNQRVGGFRRALGRRRTGRMSASGRGVMKLSLKGIFSRAKRAYNGGSWTMGKKLWAMGKKKALFLKSVHRSSGRRRY